MVITAASSLSLGASKGQLHHGDGSSCSTSHGIAASRFRSSFECCQNPDLSRMRCWNPPSIPTPFRRSSRNNDICLWRASVASDYSDSLSDSSNFTTYHGYHPLEEVKASKSFRKIQLTSAETARTTIEANNTALLIFPGRVHHEPHKQISWAEFPYAVDMYGDIFFDISDEKNILEDPGAGNLVTALFDMDLPIYKSKRIANQYGAFGGKISDDLLLDDEFDEPLDYESSNSPVDWSIPNLIHPIYFAKCVTKISDMEYEMKMDYTSNGVSIVGYLEPIFEEDESYARELFCDEDRYFNISDWKDAAKLTSRSERRKDSAASTYYRLDLRRMELFSVYGAQTTISLKEFQEAEPDPLLHSTHATIEHVNEYGGRFNEALKALCLKKGLHVKHAHLVAVDSLGLDVRIVSGVEVQTHRFPFKAQATTIVAAEKQIQQLLFPRARRRKPKSQSNGLKESKAAKAS